MSSQANHSPRDQSFEIEEATIADFHAAIRSGKITVLSAVQRYIERVRAFNGVASMLVTEDGKDIDEVEGTVRGTDPLRFPVRTMRMSDLLPDLEKYKGLPLEYGRMESTASDPSVKQQFGTIVGIPNAGQVNALGTLNIRGERSVTCRGEYD